MKIFNLAKNSIFSIITISIVFLTLQSVFAASPVTWINAVNVTVSGNSIIRNDSEVCNGCTTGAISQQQITSGNGYVEVTTTPGSAGYFGLGNNTSNSTSHLEINYGIGFGNGGWVIRELNYTYRDEGTYNIGDIFKIAVEGTQVKYYKNNTLLYTSTLAITYPLVVDTSLFNPNSRIDNAVIENGQSSSNLVSNRCSAYDAPLVSAPQRTLYIDATNGNDSNNGQTSMTAWKTLNKANSSAIAGDLILLRGVFTNQWISPANSGTSANNNHLS